MNEIQRYKSNLVEKITGHHPKPLMPCESPFEQPTLPEKAEKAHRSQAIKPAGAAIYHDIPEGIASRVVTAAIKTLQSGVHKHDRT